MKRIVTRGIAIAAVSMFVLVGCSDSDDGGAKGDGLPEIDDSEWVDMTGQAEVVVDARDNFFDPENIIVSPDTEIVFKNAGKSPHNVLPADKGDFEEIPVDKLQPKDEASITLDKVGEVPYYCSLHGTPTAGMKGRIKVADD